jgi:hypothetical protein
MSIFDPTRSIRGVCSSIAKVSNLVGVIDEFQVAGCNPCPHQRQHRDLITNDVGILDNHEMIFDHYMSIAEKDKHNPTMPTLNCSIIGIDSNIAHIVSTMLHLFR